MSLLDIDPDTPRRIEGIAADGLRALGELRERAKEIDKAADEMFASRERQRQELDEQVKQAAAQNAKPEEKQPEEPKPRPKPSTLSLGADEFKEARQARKAAAEPQRSEPPKHVPPAPKDEQPGTTPKLGARSEDETPKPNRTLKLGARDDDAEEAAPKPVRRPRPPRQESDDDMSGRTWLR